MAHRGRVGFTVTVAAVGALALLAGATGCSRDGTTRPGQSSATTTSTPASPAGTPSQSPSDAGRDGVVPAVAALPLAQRMVVQTSVEAPEGVWVISRIAESAQQPGQGCRIGPEEGTTPTDWICTSEYGEVLLLDAAKNRILRAYPLAGVPPEILRLADDAVYCARPGDSGLLPDSMACRIDRQTLAASVRIFPGQPDSVVVQPCFYPPASWSIDDQFLDVTDLAVDRTDVRARNADGTWTTLNRLTLEPGRHLTSEQK
jgi:hypothetical protein